MHTTYRVPTLILCAAVLTTQAAVTEKTRPALATHAQRAEYGKLPLAFEPNVGQTDSRVLFLVRGGGMTAYFTDTETEIEVGRQVVGMKLEGATRPRKVTGAEKQPGISNYFIGNDPKKWRTDVPHYGRIQYEGVYAGIDMVWYGNQRQLEYDFVVGPGADPSQIQVAYEGVEELKVEANGDLVLRTSLGEMRQQRPKVYQVAAGRRVEVGGRYSILARNQVGFEVARYDRKRELLIDPVVLVYSSFLGGSGDEWGQGIAVDKAGSTYVTGLTNSANFPTQSAYQAALPGVQNAFVTKLTPAGDALVYSTYLGGSGGDSGSAIAVDAAGSAYIGGYTNSTDFPITALAYQGTLRTGSGLSNGFVTKLTPAGNALVYSTYLGGNGNDAANGIAVDAAGSAYVTGKTNSTNFPTTTLAFQAAFLGNPGGLYYNGFVTKFTPAGSALDYSTYLGGSWSDSGSAIAVDAAGSAYVTGAADSADFPTTKSAYQPAFHGSIGYENAFVTKLMPNGNTLAYSTFLGGSGGDGGAGIAVDAAGSAYVAGRTYSADFPTQSPLQATYQGKGDAFVTKLTPSGDALVYSTYLGGSGGDGGAGIAVDAAGFAYVTGSTGSTNFPTKAAYQASLLANPLEDNANVFVAKLTPGGNALFYSTYLGGSGSDSGLGIAVDGTGSAAVTGQTNSANFPTQSPYQGTLQGYDGFVTRLVPFGAGAVPIGSFDTPAISPQNVSGGVGFTGWALSMAGISVVDIWRDPNPGEATQSNGLVYIGTASSITGSRPDVEAAYPNYPENNSAGWGYLILTNELPSNSGNTGVGNGTYKIHAIAHDLGGASQDLGVKTIVVDNKDAIAPFGAIDTPTQGGTASGSAFVNFGWALTPQPKSIATNGSTIVVFIDNKPVGHPVYNNPRADIEALFPGYANTNGAVGYYKINTTQLTNGLHSISWGVTDSAGQKSGIGSRFFVVQN